MRRIPASYLAGDACAVLLAQEAMADFPDALHFLFHIYCVRPDPVTRRMACGIRAVLLHSVHPVAEEDHGQLAADSAGDSVLHLSHPAYHEVPGTISSAYSRSMEPDAMGRLLGYRSIRVLGYRLEGFSEASTGRNRLQHIRLLLRSLPEQSAVLHQGSSQPVSSVPR